MYCNVLLCHKKKKCLLSLRPFCARPKYTMRKKLFVRERLLHRLLNWDVFFKGEGKEKNACYGTV